MQARTVAGAVFSQPTSPTPFQPGAPSSAHGEAARDGTATAADAPSASREGRRGPGPFSVAQTEWLQLALSDAVGASIGAFANHVAQGIAEVREEISTMRFVIAEADTRSSRAAAAAESDVTTSGMAATDAAEALRSAADLRASLDALAAQVKQLRASPSASGDVAGRRLARIGNLGWDESPQSWRSAPWHCSWLLESVVTYTARWAPLSAAKALGRPWKP